MDLTTHYLGLALNNPLIASSSPLNLDIGNIRLLEDNGAAAVVLPSIFEEQIELEAAETERLTTAGIDSFPEALSYFPAAASYHAGPSRYLDVIRQAHDAVDIPVIASLNGNSDGGWTEYARLVEQAGADAIELNVFFIPADPLLGGRQVEQRYIDVLQAVKQAVHIPVAMKLNPYFSAIGNFVCELDRVGADGFVLFNRFYQPDIDLIALHLRRDLELSTPMEIRLPLLWIGVLAGQVRGSLAATSGVETAEQVIKYLLVGADVVMTTSALLRHGVGHIKMLVDGLTQWLDAREVASIGNIRGTMSHRRISDPTAFERANYIQILQGWKC
jgi:dihydroorotate dehydrogenase (fumarate)